MKESHTRAFYMLKILRYPNLIKPDLTYLPCHYSLRAKEIGSNTISWKVFKVN